MKPMDFEDFRRAAVGEDCTDSKKDHTSDQDRTPSGVPISTFLMKFGRVRVVSEDRPIESNREVISELLNSSS